MRELGKYKVTLMVTVDLVAFDYRQAVGGAFDILSDALIESGMAGDDGENYLRVTGIAKDSSGDDMVYRYDVVAVESLI